MITRLASILVAVTALAWLTPSAHAAGGTIAGTVTNGTAGAPIPVGLNGRVHSIANQAIVESKPFTVDERGFFRVEGLTLAPGALHVPTLVYRGVTYFPSAPIDLSAASEVTTRLTVFETTESDAEIAYERANVLVLNASTTTATIMEMGALVNRGDRTLIVDTGAGPTLRFAVPSRAFDVAPQAGFGNGDVSAISDGFTTTESVPPGRREIAFSYQIPVEGGAIDLSRQLAYPAQVFNLYLPVDGPRLVSRGLSEPIHAELGGRTFGVHSATNVAAGTSVGLKIRGLPRSGLTHDELSLVVLLGGGLPLAGLAGLAIWRNRRAVTAVGTAVLEDSPAIEATSSPSLTRSP
jgi:hypothetical protein